MDTPQSTTHESNSQISPRNKILLRPRSHPARPYDLYLLGSERLQRRELSHQDEELDHCILQLTEAILLPHRPWDGHRVNIAVIFSCLASALLRRSKKSEQPDDVNSVIDYYRWLQDNPLEAYGTSRNGVMVSLVEAFSVRARLGSGDLSQDIEAMITLCEKFKQDSSGDFTDMALSFLTRTVKDTSFKALCGISDTSIQTMRGASMRWPSCPALSYTLAISLMSRFYDTYSDDYYKEAAVILNRIIVSSSCEDNAEFWSTESSALLVTAATLRSLMYRNPAFTEETISHLQSLRCSSSDDGLRRYAARIIEPLKKGRLLHFGIETSQALKEPVSRTPKVVDTSPSLCLDPSRDEVPESGAVMTARSSETLEARIHPSAR